MSSRNEDMKKLASTIEDEKTKEYVLKRMLPTMQWYSDESSKHMVIYRVSSLASLVASASIPVVSLYSTDAIWAKVVIAFLGAVVTFLSAFLILYDAKNVWVTCRNTREMLNSVFYQYYTGEGIFAECKNQDSRNSKLVKVSEEIINNNVEKRMSNYAKASN